METTNKNKIYFVIAMIVFTVSQPVIWFGIYKLLAFLFGGHWLLVTCCILGCIGAIIGILWFMNWLVNEEEYFD